MANKWVQALKKYNHGQAQWCVPRKGTAQHKEVLDIMQGKLKARGASKTFSSIAPIDKAIMKAEKRAKMVKMMKMRDRIRGDR